MEGGLKHRQALGNARKQSPRQEVPVALRWSMIEFLFMKQEGSIDPGCLQTVHSTDRARSSVWRGAGPARSEQAGFQG